MISSFSNRFSLSEEGKNSFLSLLHVLLPAKNKVPKTFSSLSKKLKNYTICEIKEEQFCVECLLPLKGSIVCLNDQCEQKEKEIFGLNSFYSIKIEPQLKLFVAKYYELICQYINTKSKYFDLIDGSHYKNKKGTLHLIIYADGIPIFKNGMKFWPVFCSLVELPSIIRNSKQNKMKAGVWYGKMIQLLTFYLVNSLMSLNISRLMDLKFKQRPEK